MKNLMVKTLVAAALVGSTTTAAQAAEYYPRAISLRSFGTDQGDVGDCQTAAEVGALEGVFANLGWSFVKLSLFYRHAANWAGYADKDVIPVAKLQLDANDRAFIQKAGPLLPDYMWPEDGEGYDPSGTGIRPHPAQSVVWDPEFPSASTLGFGADYFTFKPGFRNFSNFDAMKAAVAAGNAVTISLHADLFQPGSAEIGWDPVTGFLAKPYNWDTLMKVVAWNGGNADTGVNHAMMVVGFDDSLYAGQYPTPGAFIVRNSWNSGDAVAAVRKVPTPEQQALLAKMRLRIYSQNLPGFYALPYQYVRDMIAHQVGGFEVLHLNYGAFAAKYQALRSRYQVERLPFVCDAAVGQTYHLSDPARKTVAAFGRDYRILKNPALSDKVRSDASKRTYHAALRELQRRDLFLTARPLFRYAKLSRHEGQKVDRADDFYAGAFQSYYCPGGGFSSYTGVWPGPAQLAAPGVRDALVELGENGSTFTGWYQYLRALSGATP